ncbi:hypothetical protein [Phenylobacterium sp.]|uniref:hypothetical protein n=1 Tax=Phenylobacterium sp. TaxID=1871053 RepID=UPI00301DFB18
MGALRLRLRGWRPPATGLIPMPLFQDYEWQGVVFHFNKPIPIGVDAAGWPFTRVDPTAALVDTTPSCEDVPAPTYQQESPPATISGASYVGGGLMIDPYLPVYNQLLSSPHDKSIRQGFEALLETNVVGGSSASAIFAYDPALNDHPRAIDPGTGEPRGPRALDRAMALVQSVRLAGLEGPPAAPAYGGWRHFDSFAVFNVVDGPGLPVGSFLPATSATDKTVRFNVSMIDKRALPGGSLPGSMLTMAACEAPGYFPDVCRPFYGQFGEWLRRMVINDALGANDTGYSRGYGILWSDWMAALLSEGPDADDALVYRAVRFFIDLLGLYERGYRGLNGAGQAAGYAQFMYLGAMLFEPTYPELLGQVMAFQSNPTHQAAWTNASLVGAPVPWNANHQHNHVAYMEEHCPDPPRPIWIHTGNGWPTSPSPRHNADQDADYETTSAGVANFPEALNIGRMKRPSDGQTLARILNGGSPDWSSRTERGAMFAWLDRYRTYVTSTSPVFSDSGTSTILQRHRDYYGARRPDLGVANWTGVPEAATPNASTNPTFNRTPNFLWPVSGGFAWDMSGLGNYSEDITDYHIQYSLDQMTWVDTDVQVESGSQTGRPPVKHYVRWRRQSFSGWGPWSVNTKRLELASSPERMVLTPLGSHAGATTNTVLPAIHVPKYPRWWGPFFVPAADPMDLSENVVAYAGLGDWEGDLSAGFDIQWYRDDAPIPGEINVSHVIGVDDLGTYLKHSVTCGDVTVFSEPILIGARPALAAGVVCDITGAASDELYFAEVLASFRAHSTNVDPAFALSGAPGTAFTAGETVTSSGSGVGVVRVREGARIIVQVTSPFLAGEAVTGATSGASAEIVQIASGVVVDPGQFFRTEGEDQTLVAQGVLRGNKSSNVPTLRGDVAARVPLEVGETYAGVAHVGIGLNKAANNNTLLRLGSAMDGQDYLTEVTITNGDQPKVVAVPIGPFVAATAACWVRLRTNTSSGGSAGGDPQFDRIFLEKIS